MKLYFFTQEQLMANDLRLKSPHLYQYETGLTSTEVNTLILDLRKRYIIINMLYLSYFCCLSSLMNTLHYLSRQIQ